MRTAVIFAGGVGSRMKNSELPKQFMEVKNTPIIIHTLQKFQDSPLIDNIVISILEDYKELMQQLVSDYNITKVKSIVKGGETGQLSIYNGLIAADNLDPSKHDHIVLIHDAVRPNIDEDLLTRNVQDCIEHGSSITVSKATETFLVTSKLYDVDSVEDRDMSYIAKAPQCFLLENILNVHKLALAKGDSNSIDSCTLMTNYGHKLHLTIGSSENFKVTTPADYYMFKGMIEGGMLGE